jgi:aspartate/methionine/tyrosine aminotransferase
MITSKLPNVGITIFTQMSQLAAQTGALNLSQGFPDFDGPQALRDAVGRHIAQGHNQYSPMTGLPALRQQIAAKIARSYDTNVDADQEVTVTPGATQAIFCAIAAVVNRATKSSSSTQPTTATSLPCNWPAGVACMCHWAWTISPSISRSTAKP